MKTLIQLSIALIGLGLVSCSDDIVEPAPIIAKTEINKEFDFSHGNQFLYPLDIDGNGSAEFAFRGVRFVDEQGNNMTGIILVSNREGNETLVMPQVSMNACGNTIEYDAARIIPSKYPLSGQEGRWVRDPLLYLHAQTPSECSFYQKHYTNDEINRVGIRFTIERHTFYGWVSFKAEETNAVGCPESADKWTLLEYAFNKVSGQGVDVE